MYVKKHQSRNIQIDVKFNIKSNQKYSKYFLNKLFIFNLSNIMFFILRKNYDSFNLYLLRTKYIVK